MLKWWVGPEVVTIPLKMDSLGGPISFGISTSLKNRLFNYIQPHFLWGTWIWPVSELGTGETRSPAKLPNQEVAAEHVFDVGISVVPLVLWFFGSLHGCAGLGVAAIAPRWSDPRCW